METKLIQNGRAISIQTNLWFSKASGDDKHGNPEDAKRDSSEGKAS